MPSLLNDIRCRLIMLLVPALIAGCSVKTYPNDLPKNFHVTTTIQKTSSFRNTSLAFDIHTINAKCETDFLGRVYVDDPKTEVGVPVDRPVFLDFIFVSKVVLSNSVSSVRYQTVMTPRSGYDYDAVVSYNKGIYNVVITEKNRGGSASRKIPHVPLESCKPGKARGDSE
jgi:hypothetical protein